MVWKPTKALGLVTGLVILLTIISIGNALFQSIARQDVGMGLYLTVLLLVLSLALLGLWGYWYYDLITLRYHLDRNALTIVCGTSRQVVPIKAIQRIVPGDTLEVSRRFHGIGWPGYMRGHAEVRGQGRLTIHSTEPLERQVIIVTAQQCYGISPKDPQRFLADYAMRRALGPMAKVNQGLEYRPVIAWPVWRDWRFWLVSILVCMADIVLFGLVVNRYAILPERMPLHRNALGEVDRIASKAWLFVMPGIGVLVLGINTALGAILHRRERLGAYLLIGIACGVQVILWFAALGILNR